MRHLPADLLYSLRLLRRQPGLAVTAVVALAMGIGFTTSMFAIVHGGTRALPVDRPHEIVVVTAIDGRGRATQIRPSLLRHWQASLQGFESVGAWRDDSFNVSGQGLPDRVSGAAITPNTLAILGVRVQSGRPFTEGDAAPGAARVALISDDVWRSRFQADPGVLGQTIRLDDVPHTVVGVMPPKFGFPIKARIWTPLDVTAGAGPQDGDPLQVFGRLRDDVAPAFAEGEASAALARLASANPGALSADRARVTDFLELETPREMRQGLTVLVAVVSLAFLVACANVANLLLARAAARTRDTALRTALGASRRRLVSQALIEAACVSSVACALGVAMASVALRVFAAASAGILEAFWVDFRIDFTVVAFAFTLAMFATFATALVPALRATSARTSPILQAAAPNVAGLRIGRLGRALVVVQVALACGLFVLTATFVGAAGAIRSIDLVYPAREILTTTLSVPSRIAADPQARRAFLRDVTARVAAAPGLGATAFASALPGRGGGNSRIAFAASPAVEPGPMMTAGVAVVTPELFALAGVDRVPGRLLTWEDDWRTPPVAVVNQSFVRKFSPDREVIGRRIVVEGDEFAVVGVVPDLLMQDVADRDASGVYVSMLQVRPYAFRTMTLAGASPLVRFPAFREAVQQVNPDLPVLEPASLYDAIYADKKVLDVLAGLFLAFGAGTVFLAVIGLFAVLSFAVTARRREFGVRLALGATPRDLASLVLGRGAREVGAGLGIGLAVAFAISRGLAATLENAPAAGAGVFGVIVLAVCASAALALWRPVRRAATVSAMDALRD
jgi:predicted permease